MLEPLFDAELDYQPGMAPLTSQGDGVLIGSGDGAVHGPKLNGKLEWTLFEQPGSTMCAMAPVARIITDDGAQIRFDGRGYGTRPSQSDPGWRVAATLHFTTDGRRVQRGHPPRPLRRLPPANPPRSLTSGTGLGPAHRSPAGGHVVPGARRGRWTPRWSGPSWAAACGPATTRTRLARQRRRPSRRRHLHRRDRPVPPTTRTAQSRGRRPAARPRNPRRSQHDDGRLTRPVRHAALRSSLTP